MSGHQPPAPRGGSRHHLGPSGAGTVMLDIGADTGALVIATGPEWHGREIEISRKGGDPRDRTHVAVRERRTAGGVRFTAVFGSLPAGAYVLWRDAAEPAGHVVVAAGTVTEVDWWPSPPSPPSPLPPPAPAAPPAASRRRHQRRRARSV